MTGKEIISKALNFEQTDLVPYWIHAFQVWEGGTAQAVDEHYGNREWRERYVNLMDYLLDW